MMKVWMTTAACLAVLSQAAPAAPTDSTEDLDAREKSIVEISAFTASGDLEKLRPALARGLESGLTVSEVKEVLVQLYAYTGFPRSLNGIHLFMTVMDEREKSGVKDEPGREPSPMPADFNRDQYGAQTRARLAGLTEIAPPAGYQVFAPAVDAFLKEHLFADIFQRDNLDWRSRELATISALSAMTGTAGQQRFHLNAALNMGLSEEEMTSFIELVRTEVGEEEARVSREVLNTVLENRKKQGS